VLHSIFDVPVGCKCVNGTLLQIRYQQNISSTFVPELQKEKSIKTPLRPFFCTFNVRWQFLL